MSTRVHLVNPSDLAFGVAIITPRWLYVLAAATGSRWGDPHLVDETLDPVDPAVFAPGDVVGIGIHTGNALRGYAIGRLARARGAMGSASEGPLYVGVRANRARLSQALLVLLRVAH